MTWFLDYQKTLNFPYSTRWPYNHAHIETLVVFSGLSKQLEKTMKLGEEENVVGDMREKLEDKTKWWQCIKSSRTKQNCNKKVNYNPVYKENSKPQPYWEDGVFMARVLLIHRPYSRSSRLPLGLFGCLQMAAAESVMLVQMLVLPRHLYQGTESSPGLPDHNHLPKDSCRE